MPPENPEVTPPLAVTPSEPAQPRISKADATMLEPGEHVVTIVHRHPIGIVFIYLEALAAIIALAVLLKTLAPSFVDNLSGSSYALFMAGVVLALGLVVLTLFVATYIYRQSRLIVSNKSLIQIIQRGLFIRKVSRLSMSNVEDVTAEHKGILATIFNYGTLEVQTAGKMENFIFPWCPNPDFYADKILEARQAYARSLEEGNEAHTPPL